MIPLRTVCCITFSCELCFKHYGQIKDDKYKPIPGAYISNKVVTDLTTKLCHGNTWFIFELCITGGWQAMLYTNKENVSIYHFISF
jgi:hypothetical protein